MKKRVQIQNVKTSQILDLNQTKLIKGGDNETITEDATNNEIIIEDTTSL